MIVLSSFKKSIIQFMIKNQTVAVQAEEVVALLEQCLAAC